MSLSSMKRSQNVQANSFMVKNPLQTNITIEKNTSNDYRTFSKPRSSVKTKNYK